MSTNRRPLCLLLLSAAAVALSGCSQLSLPKKVTWPWEKDSPGNPTKVAAMWTDTVLYQPNETPKRGFGGRLMFYDGKKTEPIKVEGMVVVYAYEEDPQEPNKVKPDRKYVFTKEQFAAHYSKSKLGHSYSVWLPWDQAGGPQKTISLIVRFMPEKGDVVVSEQSKHVLPGAETEAAAAGASPQPGAATNPSMSVQAATAGGNVQATAYEQPAAGQAGTGDPQTATKRRMNTTTIPMPSRLNRPAPLGAAAVPPVSQQAQPQSAAVYSTAVPAAGTVPAAAGVSTVNRPMAHPAPGIQQNPPAAWQTTPQSRFAPARPRALGEPISPLPRERGQWPQSPAGWPSSPASSPSPANPPAATASGPAPAAG